MYWCPRSDRLLKVDVDMLRPSGGNLSKLRCLNPTFEVKQFGIGLTRLKEPLLMRNVSSILQVWSTCTPRSSLPSSTGKTSNKTFKSKNKSALVNSSREQSHCEIGFEVSFSRAIQVVAWCRQPSSRCIVQQARVSPNDSNQPSEWHHSAS